MDSQPVRRRFLALGLVGALFVVAAPAQAAFPGKNGKLAISGVETLNPDGSGLTFLAPGSDPVWSPDGKEIAFMPVFDYVYVMDQNGLNQRLITTSAEGDRDPTWSPDGKRLAFVRGRTEIYSIRLDGTQAVNLTRTPTAIEAEPAWSPDGQKIAFTSDGNIFTMNADGMTRTQLTFTGGAEHPDWSPDSSKIAYGEFPTGYDPYDYSLHVMNADGSGNGRVVEDRRPMYPAWSPDGRYLVFEKVPFGLFLLDFASGKETGIPNPPRGVIYGPADWQPIPAPKRNDYENSTQFCRADRAFLGEVEFRTKYGTKSDANAFGKCVAQHR